MHSECFCARIASLAACASGLGGPRPLVIFFQKKFAFVTGLVTECARRRTAELDRRITSRGFAHSLTRLLSLSLAHSLVHSFRRHFRFPLARPASEATSSSGRQQYSCVGTPLSSLTQFHRRVFQRPERP